MRIFTWSEFNRLCEDLADKLEKARVKYLYAVPKNGAYIVIAMMQYYAHFNKPFPFTILTEIENISPNQFDLIADSTCIIDDLIDSGRTLSKFLPRYSKAVLIVKGEENIGNVDFYVDLDETRHWIKFPWEKEEDIQDSVVRILEFIGEDVNSENLRDTPKRVVKSWEKIFGGYKQNPVEILGTKFEEYGNYDEMVVLKDIDFYSTCSHHLLPFYGKCSIAYIPDKKVVGISKLARLVEVFARRLQIQEQLTSQIAETLNEVLQPLGVAVYMEAQHFCMTSRGVEKQNSKMVTSKIMGNFNRPEVRQEFFDLIK